MGLPLVSVLIPMYNSEEYIAAALESCIKQTYKNIEIIVVDDGSTDNSLSIVQQISTEHPNLYVFKQQNRGACAARNLAFEKSHGLYVQYLDSDDLLPLKKIEIQLKALLENDNSEKTVAFSSFQHLRDGEIIKISQRKIDKNYDNPKELLLDLVSSSFNLPHCYLTPRFLIEQSGGWDESVFKNQDGEFFSRILFLADKALFTPNVTVSWRHTGFGISSTNTLKTIQSQLYVVDKISDLILSYSRTDEATLCCASQYGWLAYHCYPEHKQILSDIKLSLKKRGLILNVPPVGRLFKVLEKLLGWRIAARTIKNRQVIAICSIIKKFQ